MKLTEQHVSDFWLDEQIKSLSKLKKEHSYLRDGLNALLELKQRRAEFQEQAKRFADMMLHRINGTNEDEKCPKI